MPQQSGEFRRATLGTFGERHQAGDAAAARDQYAALVPVIEQVLGPEHPDTLLGQGNLAHWAGRAGDAAAARDQYAALVPVIEQVLGPEHRATLASREELGYWTSEADSDVSPA
jgi:hypothetical protein